jgi:RNA polymerase sigma factor (TIGR02999 family)
MYSPTEVTKLLRAWGEGDRQAFDSLVSMVYEDLRHLAHGMLRAERRHLTLQTTMLVHEAYLRLVGEAGSQPTDRLHFQRIAARAMRQVLVDRARARNADKRGGGSPPLSLDEAAAVGAIADGRVVAVHEALEMLEALDPPLAEIVELRFFGGLTHEEAAEALGLSPATAWRQWRTARTWLHRQLSGEGSADADPNGENQGGSQGGGVTG